MAEERVALTKRDRLSIAWRHQFLQGSWNYERMQNGGWCYSIIPAIKKLYKDKDDQIAALKRHMEFYNTHPYVSAPVMGVTLALEEDRANGAPVDDVAIQGVKVGMMGPLAGVGDPVFWFTLRPILGALGASFALSGSIIGPLLFFFAWNIIRMAFLWYTQEFGYHVGTSITKDLSGGLMGKITEGASILGMFIIGSLVQRWVSISFTPIVSSVQQSVGSYIVWETPTDPSVLAEVHNTGVPIISEVIQNDGVAAGIREALTQFSSLGANALDVNKVTTLQANLDSLIPGLAAVGLTLLCCWLLKKKVSPIAIILALFVVGIVGRVLNFM
ncbi:MAG TPA: PTS mannose/fructose/sorbose transporter family subunit IID [Candidatus Coprovicinus avistercoris]|uniref:PTS mannose/fructose/sorbose transporter family subunit IID n=1 Tax=Candidatus Coprovicinus avistercoris TaxID=2840754 RepID=A0A9D1HXL8_9ACTN|nr:PTS mannose/fructose/sorbose transporter family subunit IID [Candidatus Coprovicinus avistercoris]